MNALGRFLFVFNSTNANRLLAGQEIPGLEGLRGSDLDQALVGFEQTLVGFFLNNFNTDPILSGFVGENMSFDQRQVNPGNIIAGLAPGISRTRECCLPIPSRQQVIDDVSSAFNGPITRLKISRAGGITGRAFLNSVGASSGIGQGGSRFDFGRFEDRVGVGLNLINELSR